MLRQQLRTSLNTKLSQRLTITPSLLQRIELLTLNRLELAELVQQELAENPALEESDATPPAEADAAVESKSAEMEAYEDFDYEYFFGEYLAPNQRLTEYEKQDDRPSFDTFLATPLSLTSHVNRQLNLLEIAPDLYEVAYFLTGNINGDGYLAIELDEVAEQLGITNALAEQALAVVQTLDPSGVGCRNLQECLLIQIRAAGLEGSLAETLITNFLPELQLKRYAEIARRRKCSLREVTEAVDVLRTFDPKPGLKYSSKAPVYIQPDVYFYRDEDGYRVSVADDGMPKLRLSRTYQALLRQKDLPGETKKFIRERMQAAIELLKSIDQRQDTVYRVCEAIVGRQEDFFRKGLIGLRPMLIKDVAEELGLHSSTVSRVVANKYAHTAHGIIELRKFFTLGVEGIEGGSVSALQVKEKIRRIIAAEDSQKPLSDRKITDLLNHDGVRITRRTVAKYRDQMNIAGSRDRRQAASC